MTAFPFEIEADGWVEALSAQQLTDIRALLDNGMTEEQVADMWLSQAGAQTNVGFGSARAFQSFFANLRGEFVAFICGDLKYEKERADASAIYTNGKLAVVIYVSGFIATNVGLAAVAVLPVVALMFSVAGKMGVGAFCKQCGAGERPPP